MDFPAALFEEPQSITKMAGDEDKEMSNSGVRWMTVGKERDYKKKLEESTWRMSQSITWFQYVASSQKVIFGLVKTTSPLRHSATLIL